MRHPSLAYVRVVSARRAAIVLSTVFAIAACSGGQPPQKPQQPPVPVDVKTVQPHSVDVYSEYPGRVEGKRTVQVLARVEGVLEERHYTEGQIVHKGDLLFSIDQKPFRAVEKQRKAELASARASLNQAQRNWKRVKQLYAANAVSEAERDDGLSQLETSRAGVQQAQANLEAAQIDLSYTRVNAPLTGVTSLRETDEGSLVQNGSRLTTITQLNPVYVLFALPEDDAFARGKALSEMGAQTTDTATREATIILSTGQEYPTKGVVDFTQSTINPDTGTVQLRAAVQNSDNVLMPGRYVRARIRLGTRPKALVVPNVAVSDSHQRTQVFVVTDDGKAKAVPVELGPSVATGQIISQGLAAGDRVITSGLAQVKPGAPVKVKKQGGAPASGDKKPAEEQAEAEGRTHARVEDHLMNSLRLAGPLPRTRVAANDPVSE